MGTSKSKIAKNVKGILFEKRVMYILYFKSCESKCQIIIIIETWIGVAFVQVSIISSIFRKKRN